MGLQSRAQELDNLRTELQDRQAVIKTMETQSAIRKEIND